MRHEKLALGALARALVASLLVTGSAAVAEAQPACPIEVAPENEAACEDASDFALYLDSLDAATQASVRNIFSTAHSAIRAEGSALTAQRLHAIHRQTVTQLRSTIGVKVTQSLLAFDMMAPLRSAPVIQSPEVWLEAIGTMPVSSLILDEGPNQPQPEHNVGTAGMTFGGAIIGAAVGFGFFGPPGAAMGASAGAAIGAALADGLGMGDVGNGGDGGGDGGGGGGGGGGGDD